MSNEKQPSFFLCGYDRKKTILAGERKAFPAACFPVVLLGGSLPVNSKQAWLPLF